MATLSLVDDLPPERDDWSRGILLTDKMRPRRGYHNVCVVVRDHPKWCGRWSLNAMTAQPYLDAAPMPDDHIHLLRAWIDELLGFTPSRDDVEAAVLAAAKLCTFHPIHQYRDRITWDGVPRLASMARDYLGSDDPRHGEMCRRWMIGCAARASEPGCQFDNVLVLTGKTGARKSSFFRILGGEWFGTGAIDISNKDGLMMIHAAWIFEFAEIETVINGKASSHTKQFVTTSHDSFRRPYGRVVETRGRSGTMCGTTEEIQILSRDSGWRRWWIIPVTRDIPHVLLLEMRDQLWAEAFAEYKASCDYARHEGPHQWWFDRDAELASEDENAEYAEHDSWSDQIGEHLSSRIETTVADVLEHGLGLKPGQHDRWAQMRVARALLDAGWKRRRLGGRGTRRWVYQRVAGATS